jgi:DUF971 family protein
MTTPTDASQPIVPLGVHAEIAENRLLIEWSNGHTTDYPIDWLRWQCPCAGCRGEMGMPGRLDFISELTAQETQLDDAQPVGRYAVMFFWGDGHHDGIYTYDYLLANCHCPECSQARGGAPIGVRGIGLGTETPDRNTSVG